MLRCPAESEIRKRIEGEGDYRTIEKLCLDDIDIRKITTTIKKLLQSCIKLEYLTINSCKLQSLENFPTLPNLISLELGNNELKGNDLASLIPSKQINFLNLETNEINELNDLEVLTSLSELEILIVRDNPVAEINNYRERLFNSLTSLKAVDCYNRDDNFISSDGEDSYITDKYHSWRNLEDITPEKQREAIKRSDTNPDNLPIEPEEDIVRNNSTTSQASKQQKKSNKRRKRRFESQFSDESQSNEMINQFKRKIQKEN